MLTIRDLSKEVVDMTAVRGGTGVRWHGCAGDDSEGRRHDYDHRDCDWDDRDHERCEPYERRFDRCAPVASFNLGLNGSYGN